MILILTSIVVIVILIEAYMNFRAKKVHEFCLTYNKPGLTMEKAHKLMREFWKWPLRLEDESTDLLQTTRPRTRFKRR